MATAQSELQQYYTQTACRKMMTPPPDPKYIDPLFLAPETRLEQLKAAEDDTSYAAPVKKRVARIRRRESARYRTQPITFDEIKEVDEEPAQASNTTDMRGASVAKRALESRSSHSWRGGSVTRPAPKPSTLAAAAVDG